MSFFVTRAYGTPDVYLERMILRKDGFAYIHAGFEEGFALTRPVTIRGNTFLLNYSTSTKGYVKVVLLDEDGNALPGFSEEEAEEINGDQIDGKVRWKSNKTISDLANRKVRIQFILKDANLYSFGIFDK
jgi:hypothetical protein